ncbi:MAG TPA: hypothetical protein DCL77_08480 [Prolixibacteraceae bacterium]|jgi:hypothetical protein|nr:hypothetical protein [Prolixibacteraceae bacterium]
MKNIISVIIFMIVLCVTITDNQVMASSSILSSGNTATLAGEQGDVQIAFEQTTIGNEVSGNFFADNWGHLLIGLLGFFDVVARLTPTTKDNSIVNFLTTVINAIIPNFKKGGGLFKLQSQ